MGKRSRIVHVEWRTRNVERLKQFYKKAFRWKFEDAMPGYAIVDTGTPGVGGGFMQLESGSPLQSGIVSFVESDDLASSELAIREAGGQVVASAQPVEGWGRFSIFSDPDGNQLALWQSQDSVKKSEKHAKKLVKKSEQAQADAVKSEKKAREKAEKKAAKKATKAAKEQGAKFGDERKDKASSEKAPKDKKSKDKKPKEKKKDKKPKEKKKDKKKNKGAEAGGAA